MKKHLNIDESFTSDDKYLYQLIDAAQNVILKRLGLSKEDFPLEDICMYRINEGCTLGL